VITTSPTEITCRVKDLTATPAKENSVNEMIVFLKTSEEAKCIDPACKYTWISSVPKVTKMETVFDATAGKEHY
jgi:hypothetical protein